MLLSPLEHRGQLLSTEDILVIVQLHDPQPERNRDAGQPDQYRILCDEDTAIPGRGLFKVQCRERAGVPLCHQRGNPEAGVMCHFPTEHQN